jgi:hypothetical protein
MSLLKKLRCFFQGHPCEPTGRHGTILVEMRCTRCGGLYVAHTEHGRTLIPADETSDIIFQNYMRGDWPIQPTLDQQPATSDQ